MSCCGQKRAAASRPAANRPPAERTNTIKAYAGFAVAPAAELVEIEYLAQSPVVVRGPVTGATYQFSAAAPIQRVYRQDLSALLSTRHFRMAGRMP